MLESILSCKIDFSSIQLPAPRKLSDVNYQFVQVMNATLDQSDRPLRFISRGVFAQHFDAQTNTAQRILDLVRQLRGRLADGGQSLRATQRGFRLGGFGDIDQRQDLAILIVDFERRRIDVKVCVAALSSSSNGRDTLTRSTCDAVAASSSFIPSGDPFWS